MSNNTEKEPGISIINIGLVTANFERQPFVDNEIEDSVTLDLEVQFYNENLSAIVFLSVNVERLGKQSNVIQAKMNAKFAGVFNKEESSPLDFARFCGINAPAMLYPYARLYVQETFQKATLAQIILPPVNMNTVFKDSKLQELKN